MGHLFRRSLDVCSDGASIYLHKTMVATVDDSFAGSNCGGPRNENFTDSERLRLLRGNSDVVIPNGGSPRNSHVATEIQSALHKIAGILSGLRVSLERREHFYNEGSIDLERRITAYLLMRRKRNDIFGEDLFADPAWDMMLDLYVATKVRRPISVSSCCIASGVPPTTALRWLSELERRDLVRRIDDELDKRRSFVVLTPQAIDMIEATWQHFGDN